MILDDAGFSVLIVDGKLELDAMVISFPGDISVDDDLSAEADRDSVEVLHLHLGREKASNFWVAEAARFLSLSLCLERPMAQTIELV